MFKTELNENFDFTKICRLCLSQNNELQLVSIFGTFKREIQYLTIINECTEVMVYEYDELPKNICLECVECLKKFYQFRKLVVKSEHCLNGFLSKFRNNFINDVKIECTNIKEEIISNEETTCPLIKSEKDSLALREDSEIEFKIEIVKEELDIDENNSSISEPTSIISSDKPYECRHCRKSFSRITYLKRHEKIHTGKRSYKCTQCEKSFTRSDHLKAHEKSHTGKKPYKCPKCKKSFSKMSNLTKHQRIYAGVKLYSCDQCGKSFYDLFNLNIHMRTHTGDRPYKCKLCEKSFITSSNLRAHERGHTGVSYKCMQCKKSFTQLRNLKNHEKKHKNNYDI